MPVGLVMVRVRVEVPFSAMLVGENALVMVGGISTEMFAVAVAPVPPSFELTLPVVLVLVPDVVLVTLPVMVQLLLVGMEPPLMLTVLLPTPPPLNVAPEQLVVAAVEKVIPVGRVSLTATPVRGTVLAAGFVIVMVIVEVPVLTAMLAEPNALAMVGGDTTVKVPEAVVPVPPFDELTVPVVLFRLPVTLAVTFTFTSQLLLTGIDPPVRLSELPLAAKVPPQVLLVLGVAATTMPDGNVSLTATPLSGRTLAAGLVMVSISVELEAAPTGIMFGVNDFTMVGAASTVNMAEALVPIPPLVDVRVPVVLVKAPPAVAVTFTETVQEDCALTDPPLRVIVPDPEVVPVKEPPHVFCGLGVLAT